MTMKATIEMLLGTKPMSKQAVMDKLKVYDSEKRMEEFKEAWSALENNGQLVRTSSGYKVGKSPFTPGGWSGGEWRR